MTASHTGFFKPIPVSKENHNSTPASVNPPAPETQKRESSFRMDSEGHHTDKILLEMTDVSQDEFERSIKRVTDAKEDKLIQHKVIDFLSDYTMTRGTPEQCHAVFGIFMAIAEDKDKYYSGWIRAAALRTLSDFINQKGLKLQSEQANALMSIITNKEEGFEISHLAWLIWISDRWKGESSSTIESQMIPFLLDTAKNEKIHQALRYDVLIALQLSMTTKIASIQYKQIVSICMEIAENKKDNSTIRMQAIKLLGACAQMYQVGLSETVFLLLSKINSDETERDYIRDLASQTEYLILSTLAKLKRQNEHQSIAKSSEASKSNCQTDQGNGSQHTNYEEIICSNSSGSLQSPDELKPKDIHSANTTRLFQTNYPLSDNSGKLAANKPTPNSQDYTAPTHYVVKFHVVPNQDVRTNDRNNHLPQVSLPTHSSSLANPPIQGGSKKGCCSLL